MRWGLFTLEGEIIGRTNQKAAFGKKEELEIGSSQTGRVLERKFASKTVCYFFERFSRTLLAFAIFSGPLTFITLGED